MTERKTKILLQIIRHVSLLFSSKTFEKVIYSRLNHHLPTNDILVSEQYGFWREILTENAAIELTVYSNLSKKNAC